MRQPVLLTALLLLPVYVALAAARPGLAPARAAVTGDGGQVAASDVSAEESGIAALGRAVAAMGGRLEAAALVATVPAAGPEAAERLAARLDRAPQASPAGQRRLAVEDGIGGPVLTVEWRLHGPEAGRWDEAHAALQAALAAEGLEAPVYVELSGRTARPDSPLALAAAALDGVAARDRQPWAEGPSASVAGWSRLLPPGPYPVNVQVAVRHEGGEGRFWIGWPVVRSDY
ncbi:MAG: hypothetical protein AB2385_01105 [Symbiobacterium sp.]|uniref:hypothetical protein n=1 Tax=Symbiobacterium sp. TaxID=1971213 RepID=UPI003463D638